MKRVDCNRHHRMIEIVPGLTMCECSATGTLSYRAGAVDAARALVERQGGFDTLRDRVAKAEAKAAEERPVRARSGYARPA